MSASPHRTVDAMGTRCPQPVHMARDAIAGMQVGQVLRVIADDPVVFLDLPDWCADHGHEVISMEQRRDVITAIIRVARTPGRSVA